MRHKNFAESASSTYSYVRRLFRGYVLGDAFERNAARWFRHHGDETLRLDYPLQRNSVVFDCGGYEGEWAAAIRDKYQCAVFVFEPVVRYANVLADRFRCDQAVRTFSFGLHSRNDRARIHLAANASSLFGTTGDEEDIDLRDVVEVLRELDLPRINLMKINIEGGEFDLLDRLLETRLVECIDHIQVQFHRFVPDAVNRRQRIRERLSRTHRLRYDYEFIWESWSRIDRPKVQAPLA